jgi:hypothetical protein
MKKTIVTGFSSISVIALILATLILQADGLDNFKLRYFSFTKHFHDQNLELGDLRAANIDPAKNTRIDLTQLLDGGPPKDGIPSIDNAQFDTAQTTPFGKNEEELKQVGSQVVNFNNRQIRARWDEELKTVMVEELDGTTLPSSTAFAFVYPAFFGQ